MIHLLVALMLAPTDFGNLPAGKLMVQDPSRATAVTDKFLLPGRPPDCKTDADVRQAVDQVRAGQAGDCWVRDLSAFSRHGG